MIAVVFPGQGSQKPGMGQELFIASDAARRAFETVSEAVARDMAELCFLGDEDSIRQTENAQLALYTVGLACWWSLKEAYPGISPGAFAGHSVGEYAAITAAEQVTMADCARLVARRGELMASSGGNRQGAMSAVLGLAREKLEEACAKSSTAKEVVVIANDNCPGQLVISGDAEAVGRAGELASAAGAKRVLPLNVSGAFHSPLMEEAAGELEESARRISFAPRERPAVFSNVTAEPAGEDADWPALLSAQLLSPVRWTESVANMREHRVTTFVECGSGEVLCGLIKRIAPEATILSVRDPASLDSTVTTLRSIYG